MKSKICGQQRHLDQSIVGTAQKIYDLLHRRTLTELSRAQPWLRQSQRYELADCLVRKKMDQNLLKHLDENGTKGLLTVRLESHQEMCLQLERVDNAYKVFLYSSSDLSNPLVSIQERDAPVLEYQKYKKHGGFSALSFGTKLSFYLKSADVSKVAQWIKMAEENQKARPGISPRPRG